MNWADVVELGPIVAGDTRADRRRVTHPRCTACSAPPARTWPPQRTYSREQRSLGSGCRELDSDLAVIEAREPGVIGKDGGETTVGDLGDDRPCVGGGR